MRLFVPTLLLFAMGCPTTTDSSSTDSGDSGNEVDSADSADTGDSGDSGELGVPPAVTITDPNEGGQYYADVDLIVNGTATDAEDAASTLVIAWTDETGAAVSVDDLADADGALTGTTRWTKGSHTLTLTATDSSGMSGTAVAEFVVHGDNNAPECEITSPADGSTGALGDTVELVGKITDADVASNLLSAKWTSDIDGVLANDAVAGDGTTSLAINTLSAGVHTLTLRGKDEIGATCEVTSTFTVANAPDVVILAPNDGDLFNQGETITFLATAVDDTTPPDALTIEWKDSLDGVLDVTGADASGTLTFDTASLSAGDHEVKLKVTDADGATTKVTVDFTVNGLPTAPTISITPASPNTDDDLGVSIDSASVDPEGDAITYTYAWTVDGVPTAYTSATVPASATTRGETWEVTVTANDGSGSSGSSTASTMIGNSVPTVASASLTPDPATTSDTLTCSAGSTADADGDSVATNVSWTVNGAVIASTSWTLTSTSFGSGDSVSCTVTPNDGYDVGAPVTSNTVAIDNSVPSITGATITPSPAYAASTLTCASEGYSDADGDAEATTYVWTIAGAGVGTGATLSGVFASGDTVTCTATPFDGSSSGVAMSTSVTISNTPPVLASVSLSPSSPKAGDTLTCTPGTTTDVDGTTSFTYTYAWYVNGSAVSGTASTLAGSFTRGDSVYCRVTPNDGTSTGTAATSNTITVANTAPVLSSVTLSPTTVYTDDTVSVTASGTDADVGDVLNYTYNWTVNGSAVAAVGTVLGGSYFGRGDTVAVQVTPSDGTDFGTSMTSTALTISNTSPTLPVASVSPTSPIAGVDDIVCSLSTASVDSDGDALTYSFTWTRNGSVYTGDTDTATTSTVSYTATADGDTFVCSVTATDGTDTTLASSATAVMLGAEYTIGHYTSYGSASSGEGVGYLFVEPITVSADADLYELGKKSGAATANTFSLALYSDSAGTPGTLVAYTASTSSAVGYQEIAVVGAPVAITAGTYWIGWTCATYKCQTYYSTAAADGASTNTIYYKSGYTSWPSTWPTGSSSLTGQIYNLYGYVR